MVGKATDDRLAPLAQKWGFLWEGSEKRGSLELEA